MTHAKQNTSSGYGCAVVLFIILYCSVCSVLRSSIQRDVVKRKAWDTKHAKCLKKAKIRTGDYRKAIYACEVKTNTKRP